MKKFISYINKKTGLLPFEWVMIIYAIATLLFIYFAWSYLDNPLYLIYKRILPIVVTVCGIDNLVNSEHP